MDREKTHKTLTHRFFANLIRIVLKNPKKILLLSLIFTILSVIAIAERIEIRSDLKDLMPPDAEVVKNLYTISDRMGSITTLKIFLKTPELKALPPEAHESAAYRSCIASIGADAHLFREKPIVGENWCDNGLMLFGQQFVEGVRSLETVSTVSFVRDKSFFEDNIMLYASADELEAAYAQIDAALTEARRQSGEYKACLMTSDDPSACDALKPSVASLKQSIGAGTDGGSASHGSAGTDGDDIAESFKARLRERYEASALAQIDEFPFHAIQNGGRMIALEVRFGDSTAGLKAVQGEIKRMDALRDKLGSDSFGTHVTVEYGGGFVDMKHEYDVIVADVTQSISVTILSIFALIAVFFASLRAAGRIFLPLVMSTSWSLGITLVLIGYLNLITSFIFAILLGLGIDFGIHLYSRYISERRLGYGVDEALTRSIIETGAPLSLGVVTTAAAFFSLMFAGFPGFSQFGFVAGLGVLIAFVTMTTVMPALVKLSEGIRPTKIRQAKPHKQPSAAFARRMRIAMVLSSAAMICWAGYCVSLLPTVQFEENFANLSFKPMPSENGSAVSTETFAEAKRPTSPVIAVFDNTDQVSTLEEILKRDREYKNFQWYRKAFTKSPGAMQFVSGLFPEAYVQIGQPRSLPMYAAISRTMTSQMHDGMPLFATYGTEKSLALRKYRALAMQMPETARRLTELMPEVFERNTVANGLSLIVSIQQRLPEELWAALPQWRESGQLNTISDMASIYSFLPGTQMQQQERLAIIAKIRDRVSDRNIRFLPEDARAKIAEMRPYLVDHALTIDDLPEWVKMQFKEGGAHALPPREGSGVDYAFGNIAVMYQATSTYNGMQAEMLTREARSVRIDGKPLTVATGAFVYADMLNLVKTDGLEISVIAIFVIMALAALQKRRLIPVLLVLLPSIFGMVLTLVLMGRFDLKLGLFNMVMLPVTLGISIDGAIYLFDRYQQMGKGSAIAAVRAVLPPVFMSSATTLVGFGGMIMSRHMGLNSMGKMAIIAISICFFTTFLIQPGLIVLCEKLGFRSVVPDHPYAPAEEGKIADSAESDAPQSAAT